MPPNEPSPIEGRRRRAAMRSLGIASAAAFAGGVAVVGFQHALGIVSAGYPPVVQALLCGAEDGETFGTAAVATEGGAMVPIVELPAGSTLVCRIDAPSADYATWNILGPVSGSRSGPLDTTLPCQWPETFTGQDPASLRLSACQRMRAERPGLYLVGVMVMLRGQQSADRARMLIRVVPPPPPAAAEAGTPRRERIAVQLRLPAMEAEETREANLSASFGEHGLLPQSRNFERTVYRLAAGETYLGASFRARSAANASAVRLAYDPDARAVKASFTLRSGPVIDRWRGWVTGTVAVQVRIAQPAREIDLPAADLVIPGLTELPLPAGLDASRATLVLRGTGAPAELPPGGTARLEGAQVTAQIEGETLRLEATAD